MLLNLSLAVVLYTFDLNEEEKTKIQEACFRLNALQRPVTFVSTNCTQYELVVNISPRPSKAAFPWVESSQSNQRVPGITSSIPDPWRFFTQKSAIRILMPVLAGSEKCMPELRKPNAFARFVSQMLSCC